MAWQKLPQKLEEFCSWLNSERKSIAEKDIEVQYAFSFLAHYKLVYIHPWADGNGRMICNLPAIDVSKNNGQSFNKAVKLLYKKN